MVTIRNILLFGVATIMFTGCMVKNEPQANESIPMSIQSQKRALLSDDERKIYYKGDYDINYKEPRTVWFKPLLTENGNILSERTITLSPKDLKWSNDNNVDVGEKFKELTKEKK